jgi:hypothetical protein
MAYVKNRISIQTELFEASEDGKQHITGAQEAIRVVVGHNGIALRHKRVLLTYLIWQITVAHGKYHIRYRSGGVLNDLHQKVEHEHVYTIKWLKEQFLTPGIDMSALFENIVACIVTKREHELLEEYEKNYPDVVGWERYKGAGIDVYDMSLPTPMKLSFTL